MTDKTSNRCWAYQSAVGTEAIDDATDTTYFFGKPKKEDWKVPKVLMDVLSYYTWSSREPSLTPIDPSYQTFHTACYPTTAQHIAWMLKQVEEDGEDTNVHLASVLDTGYPLPLTIRYEIKGTVDRIIQAVDCYSVGLTCSATYNTPFLVENEWAFGRLEDRRGQWKYDDTVNGVAGDAITMTDNGATLNAWAGYLVFVDGGDQEDQEFTVASNTAATPTVVTLTTTPNANIDGDTISVWDKERPILTTAPSAPGTSATNRYIGTPKVYWDAADQNVNLTECWQATWAYKQTHDEVLDSDRKYCTVDLYKHDPVQLTLQMICERHKQIYDYIDRKANQINITVYKPNVNYYITYRFYNCYVVDWTETGKPFKGHFNATALIKAASSDAIFTLESETNWSTHYKTVS